MPQIPLKSCGQVSLLCYVESTSQSFCDGPESPKMPCCGCRNKKTNELLCVSLFIRSVCFSFLFPCFSFFPSSFFLMRFGLCVISKPGLHRHTSPMGVLVLTQCGTQTNRFLHVSCGSILMN